MKSLFLGILLLIILGVGGLVYRNVLEHPTQPVACPMDALICPDGISVARTGLSCEFPPCPPPNVTLADIKLAFALPEGFVVAALPDVASIAAYERSIASSTESAGIIVRRYALNASTTALAVIQQTAISATSGLPVSATAFTSTTLGTHRFTIVTIERFEGTVDVAYYLARGTDVLRFDAIDKGVDWTNPSLDVTKLPTQVALRQMLTTLQGE